MANVHSTTPDEQPTTTSAAVTCGSMAVNQQQQQQQSEELPCEKYRQFMDSSIQERTFMIEKLVETFANAIDSIWHPKFLIEHQQVKVMPTRGFCNEILKRSKATYSTLQISLFYIFRVKKVVHEKLYQRIQQSKNLNMQTSTQMDELMCCGRRMFLASLMVASKYLHDKNYHNKAWAKITGLDIKEINAAEMAFLNLIDYRLYVSKPTFDKWYTQIHGHIQKSYKSTPLQALKPTVQPTKDNANILSINSSTVNSVSSRFNVDNRTDYPSPPPDETSSHPLAPISPKCNNNNYQRTDSGVSFDIFSPPNSQQQTTNASTLGTKRQWDHSSQDIQSKRLCQ